MYRMLHIFSKHFCQYKVFIPRRGVQGRGIYSTCDCISVSLTEGQWLFQGVQISGIHGRVRVCTHSNLSSSESGEFPKALARAQKFPGIVVKNQLQLQIANPPRRGYKGGRQHPLLFTSRAGTSFHLPSEGKGCRPLSGHYLLSHSLLCLSNTLKSP